MRGESLPVTKAPASSSELGDMVAEFSTDDVGGEARRMGCAYKVGRLAGGGSTEALAALEVAIGCGKGAGKMASGMPSLPGREHGGSTRCGTANCNLNEKCFWNFMLKIQR